MPQAVSSHHAPAGHLADVETPMSHLKAAEAAATAARAAVVAAEAAAAEKTKAAQKQINRIFIVQKIKVKLKQGHNTKLENI
jgi:hypothetical protein